MISVQEKKESKTPFKSTERVEALRERPLRGPPGARDRRDSERPTCRGAEACSPAHGREKSCPTQSALSVAHLGHVVAANGTQYNQKYHPNALEGEKGLQAQGNPEKHRDLAMRVAGYKAFFVDLDKSIQDDIIKRTELRFGG
jgi:pyruvate-formate lyase